MVETAVENLSPETQLTLAYTRLDRREPLRIFLDFDARLARIVAGTNEPMLGQMRLAWWRDTLGQPVEERPAGDAVLDAIGLHWRGEEAALVGLVNGWEHLLADPPLSEADARGCIAGRAKALCAACGVEGEGAGKAAWHWAAADLAAKVTIDAERSLLVELGLSVGAPTRLPRDARGLAVLGALGLRALKRGGRPLMEGRGASLTALRAAMLRR